MLLLWFTALIGFAPGRDGLLAHCTLERCALGPLRPEDVCSWRRHRGYWGRHRWHWEPERAWGQVRMGLPARIYYCGHIEISKQTHRLRISSKNGINSQWSKLAFREASTFNVTSAREECFEFVLLHKRREEKITPQRCIFTPEKYNLQDELYEMERWWWLVYPAQVDDDDDDDDDWSTWPKWHRGGEPSRPTPKKTPCCVRTQRRPYVVPTSWLKYRFL